MLAQDPGRDRFAAVARNLRSQTSEAATLDRVAQLAVEILAGCRHAGVSLIGPGNEVTTVAATDEIVRAGDQRQYELGEGPCLDSLRDQETVYSPRLISDARWPEWAADVTARLGVRSMVSYQLFTTDEEYGSLNLYSDSENAFDDHDRSIGLALAAHAAVALATSRNIDRLNAAQASQTIIGHAEGILMERFDLTAEQAFGALAMVSQSQNRALISIARELIDTRRLPSSPAAPSDPDSPNPSQTNR